MTQREIRPFHLAFPVDDLDAARDFYKGLLGCGEGRSSPEWVDFDFHGHQIVAHLAPSDAEPRPPARWTATACRCAISAW